MKKVNGVYDYLAYHSSNLSTQNLREEIVNMFFVKMTFLNHVRFTKRLQYIIVLGFCLSFSHKFKMEFSKYNYGIPLKLLLVWDLDTSKIHIEVWRILFQYVWIIIICTHFWKKKWQSLSIPLIWHVDVRRLKTKVWSINFLSVLILRFIIVKTMLTD